MLHTTERQERIRLLFQYYADELYRYVQCLAPREIDPKDIVQDTFVRAFQHLHRLRDETMARAWLYRITRNLLFDELRRRRIEVTCFQRLPKRAMVHSLDTSLEIYDAIRSLPLHYQHVLYLRIVQDFTLQEIASILHRSPVSVRVTLHRARKALAQESEFAIQSPYQSSEGRCKAVIRQSIDETLKDSFSGGKLPQGVKQGMWSSVQEGIRSQSVVKSSTLTKQIRPAMVWLGSILVAGGIAFGSVEAIQSRPASTTVSRHGLSPKGWHVTVPEGLQIGSLRLGAPLTDAITMYGDPQIKTTVHGTGGPEWIYTQGKPKTINTSGVVPLYSNLSIGIDGNPIWSISVNAAHSGSTPRGIHIGSTVAQLRRAYHGMFNDKQEPYAIQYDHGMFSLSFGVSDGKITQIHIVKNLPPF